MKPGQSLINSADLATQLGWSKSKLQRIRREKSPDGQALRACIWRATSKSTDWHVGRLRKAGFLLEAAPVVVVDAARSFSAVAPWGQAVGS